MAGRGRDFRELVLERIKSDPEFLIEYLNNALEEGEAVFLLALKDVINATEETVTEISKKTNLHRVSVHHILSPKGNPTLANIGAILKACGLKFEVSPNKTGTA